MRQLPARPHSPSEYYVLDLKVSSEGVITGNLRSIRVDGSQFTAMIDSRPLHATFVNRIRTGEPAFGLLVHDADVQIDDVTLSQIFCRRQTSF